MQHALVLFEQAFCVVGIPLVAWLIATALARVQRDDR